MPTESIQPIQDILHRWVLIAQALVGSVGALAFVFAFLWKVVSVDPRSVTESRRWLQRIVVGTVGVELAGILVQVLTSTLSH